MLDSFRLMLVANALSGQKPSSSLVKEDQLKPLKKITAGW